MPLLAQWTPVLIPAGINAIVALGVYVTLLSGQLSVGHAAIMGLGAYAAAIITTKLGLPFLLGIVAGTAVGALTGALLSLVTLRMSPLVVGLTTLGFGETIVVVSFNTEYFGGAQGIRGIPLHTDLLVTYVALAAVLYVAWRVDCSRIGLAGRAVRDNHLVAGTTGVDIVWVKVVTFALGAGIAGLGGALSAHYILVVHPDDMGFFRSLSFVIFVILGGSYTFWGPAVGAIFLTLLPEMLRFSIYDRFTIYGIILVIVILLRPQGLVTRVPSGSVAALMPKTLRAAWARSAFPERVAGGERRRKPGDR